jgi:hypothetical protein
VTVTLDVDVETRIAQANAARRTLLEQLIHEAVDHASEFRNVGQKVVGSGDPLVRSPAGVGGAGPASPGAG